MLMYSVVPEPRRCFFMWIIMKKIIIALAAMVLCVGAYAQNMKFIEASELNLIGKLMDTPNPYHRVDTVKYKGFTHGENIQVRCPAGLAVLFKTNSTVISVKSEFGWEYNAVNTMPMAYRGYDLYIKDGDGEWLWAGSAAPRHGTKDVVTLCQNMTADMKECMVYLPVYTELLSCKIGVEDSSDISYMESPFRHRVGIFGSSYTHGISISRAGMSYPMQFMRHTGVQILSLGCSGNCKLQDYFADVLCDAEVDALIFDGFSNPGAKMIEERLFPFIEKIQKAHPDIPLIFQQTIYRERRNFDTGTDKNERAKQEMAEKMMKEACRKYKNVYFIRTNATDGLHETSVDGTHPGDYGYFLWSKSIEKPVMKILKKYGLK